MPGQQGDVLLPLPQRGQLDGDDVQPVEEVLAEASRPSPARCRSLLVAAMTRTSTLMRAARRPTRSNSCSCSTRSSLTWSRRGHVADLVQEERAAVGQLEAARPGAGWRR